MSPTNGRNRLERDKTEEDHEGKELVEPLRHGHAVDALGEERQRQHYRHARGDDPGEVEDPCLVRECMNHLALERNGGTDAHEEGGQADDAADEQRELQPRDPLHGMPPLVRYLIVRLKEPTRPTALAHLVVGYQLGHGVELQGLGVGAARPFAGLSRRPRHGHTHPSKSANSCEGSRPL
eukprot:CAMPEP_0119062104 /NCGR_PEP_ID=MMETSP1178-20130426/5774_1 /TAXON_ID=33656 /ORGANISM="unid sp, Strain CCMP2000" /LENGTH=179 /DNA_ID=CAMNT_0007043361 /DNA_START=137 /DNA_END=674 /DNA_ORIENTATION=+